MSDRKVTRWQHNRIYPQNVHTHKYTKTIWFAIYKFHIVYHFRIVYVTFMKLIPKVTLETYCLWFATMVTLQIDLLDNNNARQHFHINRNVTCHFNKT